MLQALTQVPMLVMAQAEGETPATDAVAAETVTQPGLGDSAGELGDKLVEGDVSAAADMAMELLVVYGPKVALFLIIIIVAYFVGKFLARITSAPVRKRVDETLGRFVGKIIFYGIMVCALLGGLGALGVEVASFAAVIAAAGFAIGLAFQGTLSNFAAGVMLLVFRPFKVGDVINAAGITAKVTEIDLFVTVFDTPDNRRIVVPNSSIASGTIENITLHDHRRVDVEVGVAYDADIDKTREILEAVVEEHKGQMLEGDGRGYQIMLTGLGASSVDWVIRFWGVKEDYWGLKESITRSVKYKLDEAGIGIPYPQMDVHLFKQEG